MKKLSSSRAMQSLPLWSFLCSPNEEVDNTERFLPRFLLLLPSVASKYRLQLSIRNLLWAWQCMHSLQNCCLPRISFQSLPGKIYRCFNIFYLLLKSCKNEKNVQWLTKVIEFLTGPFWERANRREGKRMDEWPFTKMGVRETEGSENFPETDVPPRAVGKTCTELAKS